MLFWPEFSIYSTLPLNFPIISAWSSPRKGSLKFNRYRIMFNSVMSPTPPRLVTQVTTTVRTKWGNFLWHVFDSHPFRGGFIAYSCGLIMVTRVTYQQTTTAESVHPGTWGLDILDLPHSTSLALHLRLNCMQKMVLPSLSSGLRAGQGRRI